MSPRSYNSFDDMAEEIGRARVYAGIHTTLACSEGLITGKKIAENMESRLKFLKE